MTNLLMEMYLKLLAAVPSIIAAIDPFAPEAESQYAEFVQKTKQSKLKVLGRQFFGIREERVTNVMTTTNRGQMAHGIILEMS